MSETQRTWSEAESAHYRAAGHWQGVTFAALLRESAAVRAGHVALVDGDRRWTYAELDAEADRVARGLRGLGIGRGDRVVVQLPNCAEFVLVWFALQRVGAVPVHAMPGHRRLEIGHLVRVAGAVACVVPDRHARFDHRELMREVRAEQGPGGSLRHVVVVGEPGTGEGFVPFEALRTDTPSASAPGSGPASGVAPGVASGEDAADASDVALLLLSGGTTGLPKLIPRTHDDYAYNARACAEVCALDARTVYLAVLPLGFNFAFACPGVLGTLMAGGTVVVAPDPSPQTAFALVEREGVTLTSLTPPLVPHWTDEAASGSWDLGSLSVVQVGGARLPEDHARKLGPALGVTVQQVFGMAEGLINLTRLDDPEDLVCATQGLPVSPDDEVLVVDADGRPVPDGTEGELLTRGPYTLRGYYRAEEHNRTAFTPDGYYRSGDVVRRLPSGHLVVVGRLKDQINRGGEKVAAVEVEEQLLTHPAITAAALVGVPDERWGERSVAFVVCTGAAPGVRAVAAHLKERGLAGYKAPDEVVRVPRLPLTAVGKVDKAALARRLPRP
ncbi:(2,3-dihydroxybenzoyl)adenylate synthase [Streptomyces violaceoruber]|uniref:(2,3-dihydroxybenzoyl)adenylate synthase n=1 Tax=Streptomyces TaxID=1883 RepID=UPI0029B7F1C7|nr:MULTISPECIES: (2,3-dihydroxybenzoyl)adenylate synthase [unclassified Streptomyces]MDX3344335.1 (2,3-dihydroxybenzoyl)adenylate synthase [Streptomyces sp. ME02-6979A]MDX3399043.1 (2,3-dihydroxybenzoyl)adenylate synthase [Streptomyces sp. ME01-18h]